MLYDHPVSVYSIVLYMSSTHPLGTTLVMIANSRIGDDNIDS